MRFTVKRIKKRQNPHFHVVRIPGYHVFSKAETDGGGAGRTVGYVFRASLHAYGGTFDSVTCHQRRYHYARLRIMTGSLAIGCIQRGVVRSAVGLFTSLPTDDPGAPAAWLPASGMYLLALFTCRKYVSR